MFRPYPETVNVLDRSLVAPPSGSVSTTTIPLTFFDVAWGILLALRPPTSHIFFTNKGTPFRSPSTESDSDFDNLIANHARENKSFQSLVPQLPAASFSSDKTHVMPIMAKQFTVFPKSGIAIGITFNHMAADGRSFNHFMKSWASVYRSGGGNLTSISLPFHNKDVIKDPDGLSSIFLNDWWSFMKINSVSSGTNTVPQDNLRVTLVLNRVQIEKLKERVTTQDSDNNEPGPIRMSTYAVTCAFMWINLMKLQECETSGHLNDESLYHFVSVADCRERFSEFPVPAAYFGNCLAFFFASAKRSVLMGENGIVVAAKAIARAIYKLEKGQLVGAEKWILDLIETIQVPGHIVSVAGSPKLGVYETDFGWGRPKKSEVAHIGAYGAFSLNESRDGEGGIEIGLVFGRDKLEFFNAIIDQARVELNIQLTVS